MMVKIIDDANDDFEEKDFEDEDEDNDKDEYEDEYEDGDEDEDKDKDKDEDEDEDKDEDEAHQFLPKRRKAHVSDALSNDLPNRLQESISELRRAATQW